MYQVTSLLDQDMSRARYFLDNRIRELEACHATSVSSSTVGLDLAMSAVGAGIGAIEGMIGGVIKAVQGSKVAVVNLAMWVRDRYFPASYAQATWRRLLPFFQLPGTITHHAHLVQVELRPFNDRMLNRDLAVLRERVNQASPRLPDGRRLSFTIHSSCCILAAQKVGKIP